jgi:hypothetical protein
VARKTPPRRSRPLLATAGAPDGPLASDRRGAGRGTGFFPPKGPAPARHTLWSLRGYFSSFARTSYGPYLLFSSNSRPRLSTRQTSKVNSSRVK